MPVTYDSARNQYRVQCNSCSTHAFTLNPDVRDDTVHSVIRFRTFRPRPGQVRHGYYPQCRDCEREAARNRRSGNPRVRASAPAPDVRTRLPLGIDRTFGVEIECMVPGVSHAAISAALRSAGLTGWRVEHDGSISGPGGAEVVSPVLSGDDGTEQIRTATRVIRSLGGRVNRSCGLHVHHGVSDLTIDDVKEAVRVWSTQQETIDGLVSLSRRSVSNPYYCRPLGSHDLRNVENARTMDDIWRNAEKYRSMNLRSYGRYGTIEIRQHQGTLDAEKIISWVRFGQGMFDTVKCEPQAVTTRHHTMRGLLGAMGDRLNETARTFLIGRTVEFGAVAV